MFGERHSRSIFENGPRRASKDEGTFQIWVPP